MLVFKFGPALNSFWSIFVLLQQKQQWSKLLPSAAFELTSLTLKCVTLTTVPHPQGKSKAFFKMGNPRPLLVLFKKWIHFLLQINVKNYPFNIRPWDSNSKPSNHKSLPTTTTIGQGSSPNQMLVMLIVLVGDFKPKKITNWVSDVTKDCAKISNAHLPT